MGEEFSTLGIRLKEIMDIFHINSGWSKHMEMNALLLSSLREVASMKLRRVQGISFIDSTP